MWKSKLNLSQNNTGQQKKNLALCFFTFAVILLYGHTLILKITSILSHHVKSFYFLNFIFCPNSIEVVDFQQKLEYIQILKINERNYLWLFNAWEIYKHNKLTILFFGLVKGTGFEDVGCVLLYKRTGKL